MSYCKRCGAYIPDGEDGCFACGYSEATANSGVQKGKSRGGTAAAAATAAATATAPAEKKQAPPTKNNVEGEYHYSFKDENDNRPQRGATTRYSSERRGAASFKEEFDADAKENKMMGLLCYLGPLVLIPLLSKKKSSFLKYHCNQGLVLLIFSILSGILDFIPIIGWLVRLVGFFISVTGFISGIKNVLEGKRKPLPIIGEFEILK